MLSRADVEIYRTQRDVLLQKIKFTALDIEQAFGRILHLVLKTRKEDLEKQPVGKQIMILHNVLHDLRDDKDMLQGFEQRMWDQHHHVRYWAADCVMAWQNLFHGRHDVQSVYSFDTFWRYVYFEMLQTIYVHPRMYTTVKQYDLAHSITLIEEMLEKRVIVGLIETDEKQISSSAGSLTRETLRRHNDSSKSISSRTPRRATSRASIPAPPTMTHVGTRSTVAASHLSVRVPFRVPRKNT